jgi:HK97 family phage major capsid protein
LESPDVKLAGFEARLGESLRALDDSSREHEPAWAMSKSVCLPTRALARSLGAGTASSGGDLTTTSVLAAAEAARPALVLDNIGVPRLEVSRIADLSLPSWEAETVSGVWLSERGNATERDITCRTVTATPHSALSFMKYSRRIDLQTPGLEAQLLLEVRRAVAQTIEQGFLEGSNTEGQPYGLTKLAQDHGYADTWGGSAPTYSEVVEQARAYLAAHGSWGSAVWIASSDLALDLATVEKGSGTAQFVLDMGGGAQGPTLLGRPVAISDNLSAGKLLLVNTATLRTVYFGAPYALLDRYSDNMDIKGERMLLVDNYCDIVALQPAQVCLGVAA